MMKRTFHILALTILLAFALAACIRMAPEPPRMSGLVITASDYQLEGDDRVQTVSYKITLHNASLTSITLDSIQPVMDDAFLPMLVAPDRLTLKVGKGIRSGDTIEVKGKYELRTNRIPRDQLDKMGRLLRGFTVKSRQTLLLPGVPTSTPKPTTPPAPSKTPTVKP